MRARAAALCLLLLLTGCAGAGDWTRELPNGYALWRVNGRSIALGLEEGGRLEETVGGYICSFRAGERWVCVRRALEVPEDPREKIDTDRCEDFLLDTETGALYGPYGSAADTQAAAADLGAEGDLGAWTDTVPAPEGARYG